MILIYLFAFFIFLFIGSFFGVIVDRVYRGEQFITGQSYCENCKHTLGFWDLVPVFSFLFLGGKCRYCKKKLSIWLPITEILTASALTAALYYVIEGKYFSYFAEYYFSFPYSITLAVQIIIALVITSLFILIFITDAKYMVIPDIYLYILAAVYPIYLIFLELQVGWPQNFLIIKDDLISCAVLALFFAAIHYGSRKKAMGEGDIYLAGIIGLYLGTTLSIVMWFMAFLTGAVYGVILLVSGKKKMRSAVPFGPFLILGMYIALIWGQQLLNWYFSI